MATLQSLILDSADASEVEMQSYVQQLLGCLDSTARYMASHPSIRANMHGIRLDMSTAITVGSIISEVSSSLTNQPMDQNQTVDIDLERRGNYYRLAISSRLNETSLEMALIRTYASQLRGTIVIDDSEGPLAITFETDGPIL
jgi:two-component sensor histidine kinase